MQQASRVPACLRPFLHAALELNRRWCTIDFSTSWKHTQTKRRRDPPVGSRECFFLPFSNPNPNSILQHINLSEWAHIHEVLIHIEKNWGSASERERTKYNTKTKSPNWFSLPFASRFFVYIHIFRHYFCCVISLHNAGIAHSISWMSHTGCTPISHKSFKT